MLLVALISRARLAVITSGAGLLINILAIAPFYFGATHGEKSISILTMNIWGAHNKNYSKAVELIRKKNPDVVCMNEYTKDWLAEMDKSLYDYPFRFFEGISGGAAMYSKLPMEAQLAKEGKRTRRYGVRGLVTIGEAPALVIASHPPAPYKFANWQKRNTEFERLAADANSANMPVIIIGDFNSTPWSPFFQNLENKGKLEDSEYGYGIQPSWSTLHGVTLVPIDHCVFTKEKFLATRREVGPNIGSDHLPVYVELSLR